MSFLVLNAGERGIVVFKVWKSLPYGIRLALSFGLILSGFLLQLTLDQLVAGGVALFLGNLLLLVRGYDNRVDFGRFDPAADWEAVTPDKLEELVQFDKKIRDWDRSAVDITNALGGCMFVLVVGTLVAGTVLCYGLTQVLFIDALVLLVPHWVTGVRSILTLPNLMVKVQTLVDLLRGTSAALQDHKVDALVLLKGKGDTKLPDDVKIRVGIKDAHADFLGLYGQVVINMVQGTSYPYFYVVLVARKGFGLHPAFERYSPPEEMIKEWKVQDDVEVIVLRQYTTSTSGYHTDDATARDILAEGLQLAQRVARKP